MSLSQILSEFVRIDLERLGEFEPEERHADEDGVVEEVEEREAAAPQNGEVGAEDVEETREVKRVGPEEHAPRGARPDRETQQPLERRLTPPPYPPGFPDFRGGGRQDPEEDPKGDERQR